jgi:hypothetical protein
MKQKKRFLADSDGDDGFENAGIVVEKYTQEENKLLQSEIPDANPILRNLQVTTNTKLHMQDSNGPPSKVQ